MASKNEAYLETDTKNRLSDQAAVGRGKTSLDMEQLSQIAGMINDWLTRTNTELGALSSAVNGLARRVSALEQAS